MCLWSLCISISFIIICISFFSLHPLSSFFPCYPIPALTSRRRPVVSSSLVLTRRRHSSVIFVAFRRGLFFVVSLLAFLVASFCLFHYLLPLFSLFFPSGLLCLPSSSPHPRSCWHVCWDHAAASDSLRGDGASHLTQLAPLLRRDSSHGARGSFCVEESGVRSQAVLVVVE